MPFDDKKTSSLEGQENYDLPVYVSAYFESVKHGSVHNVKLMIEGCEVSVNSRDGRGMTAGHIAVEHGHCRMLKMLLSHGLDLTIKDEWGDTVPQMIEKLRASKQKMQQILDEHMERLKLQEKSGSEVIDVSSSMGSATPSRASSGSVKTLQTPWRDITSTHTGKPVKEDQPELSDPDSFSDKSGLTGRRSSRSSQTPFEK